MSVNLLSHSLSNTAPYRTVLRHSKKRGFLTFELRQTNQFNERHDPRGGFRVDERVVQCEWLQIVLATFCMLMRMNLFVDRNP